MLNQAQVAQELTWCGLGEMTRPDASPRKFEAHGDGNINVAHVLKDGTLVCIDHHGQQLHRGKVADEEDVAKLVTDLGHYAPC